MATNTEFCDITFQYMSGDPPKMVAVAIYSNRVEVAEYIADKKVLDEIARQLSQKPVSPEFMIGGRTVWAFHTQSRLKFLNKLGSQGWQTFGSDEAYERVLMSRTIS